MSQPIHHIRNLTITLFVIALALTAFLKSSRTRADNSAPASSPPQPQMLDNLRQQRIDTLTEAAKLADQLFSHGLGPIDDSIRCHKMLADAKLESASSTKQRTDILTQAIADAKNQEGNAAQRVKAGLATQLVPLEAKAYRLELEIKLATESAK